MDTLALEATNIVKELATLGDSVRDLELGDCLLCQHEGDRGHYDSCIIVRAGRWVEANG